MSFLNKILTSLGVFSEPIDKSKYKRLDSIEKAQEVNLFPVVNFPNNNKKNIVIIDDNDIAGDITKEDIIVLGNIAKVLNDKISIEEIPPRFRGMIEKFDNISLQKLSKFCLDEYTITLITGKMAGFALINALHKGFVVDYAILDVILGGSGIYNNSSVIIDGIDVASEILKINPKANIVFYTGCSFEQNHQEYKKTSKLTKNVQDMVLQKGNDLLYKKKRLIDLLTRKSRIEEPNNE